MNREVLWPISFIVATGLIVLGNELSCLPDGWWWLPWGLSLVLFGLPHGAIDHEVALKLWRPQPPPRWALVTILAAYLSLVAFVILSWFLAPYLVFIGFILLTWGHWGLSDLWWSWQRDPAYFRSRFHRMVFALWRGALPMLIPLAFDPRLYRHTAEATCNLFLRQPSDFAWIEGNVARGLALGLALVLGLADLLLAPLSAKSRRLNLLEGLSLLLFFSALPAVASVGFYFAFWHGLRHMIRLISWERVTWTGFTLQALPMTLGAVALLGGMAYFIPHPTGNWPLLGLYLALIAALTVPHALLVSWLDKRAGLYNLHL